MKKIDIEAIDRLNGIGTHDLLRDGLSPDLDPIKVSAVLKAIVENQNEMIERFKLLDEVVRKSMTQTRKTVRKINKLKKGLPEK